MRSPRRASQLRWVAAATVLSVAGCGPRWWVDGEPIVVYSHDPQITQEPPPRPLIESLGCDGSHGVPGGFEIEVRRPRYRLVMDSSGAVEFVGGPCVREPRATRQLSEQQVEGVWRTVCWSDLNNWSDAVGLSCGIPGEAERISVSVDGWYFVDCGDAHAIAYDIREYGRASEWIGVCTRCPYQRPLRFGVDESAVPAHDLAVLEIFVSDMQAAPSARVELRGSTEWRERRRVAKRRVDATRKALVDLGLDAARIVSSARGAHQKEHAGWQQRGAWRSVEFKVVHPRCGPGKRREFAR